MNLRVKLCQWDDMRSGSQRKAGVKWKKSGEVKEIKDTSENKRLRHRRKSRRQRAVTAGIVGMG